MKRVIELCLAAMLLCSPSVLLANVSVEKDDSYLETVIKKIQAGSYKQHKEFAELEYIASVKLYDDKSVTRKQRVRYYPTSEDIQNYGRAGISFYEANESVIIHSATAISPSLQKKGSLESDFKVLNSDTYDVFSSSKELFIPYNGLEAGGYTVLDYTVVEDRKKGEHDWYLKFHPQVGFIRDQYEVSLQWFSKDAPNYIDNSDYAECKSVGNTITCTGANIQSVQADEVVYWRDELGFIEFSEYQDWNQVASTVGKYFDSAMDAKDGDVKTFIDKYLQGIDSQEEKITKLHKFVARDIRYLSRSEDGHSVTPHNTTETLSKRIGDCKDKSALLMNLLDYIGVDSYPVLISTGKFKLIEERLPSLYQFDHVVVCFNHKQKDYCIDATDNYTPWDLLPKAIQGNYAFSVKSNSKPRLIETLPYSWKMQIETALIFDEKGDLNEKQVRTYTGESAASLKNSLSSYSKKEMKELLVEQYQDLVTDSVTPEIKFDEISNMMHDYTVESKTVFDAFLDIDSDLNYYEIESWLNSTLKNYVVSNKHYDIKIYGSELISKYRVDFIDIWDVDQVGADLKLVSKYGELTRTYKVSKDKSVVDVETHLKLPSIVLKKEEFEDYNKFISAIYDNTKLRFFGTVDKDDA